MSTGFGRGSPLACEEGVFSARACPTPGNAGRWGEPLLLLAGLPGGGQGHNDGAGPLHNAGRPTTRPRTRWSEDDPAENKVVRERGAAPFKDCLQVDWIAESPGRPGLFRSKSKARLSPAGGASSTSLSSDERSRVSIDPMVA